MLKSTGNFQSWQGYFHGAFSSSIRPAGTYRILNIMVNINYDQTPNLDPENTSTFWPKSTVQGINNQSIPTYLLDFMDIHYNPNQLNGMMTRLFHESSFGRLVLIGDFVVVNINQSYITTSNPGSNFSQTDLINKVFNLINNSGGLNTIYGHNSLADYDNDGNGNIDMVQFLLRNGRNDTAANFGGVNSGSGNISPARSFVIKINGQNLNQTSVFSYQGIGAGLTYTLNPTGIVTHEIAHAFFGGNTFHTSGGNHYSWGQTNSFFGLEGGYGLMGASGSGLVSCNGFERWRMNWTHQDPAINPTGNPIQARHISNSTGVPSDIKKEDGPKSFILRDFVTFGDVVRIKLPYQDNGASNQYIWLENHQIGRNDKLDYLHYSLRSTGEIWHECRPLGTPGIYSYIQVGKDILEGSSSEVYPTNETDNLRIISAEGNWDFSKKPNENPMCVRWGLSGTERMLFPNPLSGYQDQQEHFYPSDENQVTLKGGKNGNNDWVYVKYGPDDQLISRAIPKAGDQFDAFTGTKVMGIGTNPSPANFITHYVNQEGGAFSKRDNHRDNNHVYLSGLRIVMKENPDHTFRVDVSWNNYDVSENVRWAGNIVLKEKVILKPGKTITFDQSGTPNQITRDPISGLFAKPTVFTCEEGSEFRMEDNTTVNLINKSTLHLKTGSSLEIGNGASLVINSGDILKIDACAKLIIKGNGRLIVNNGGILCISPGAILATDRGMPNISLNQGFVIPSGFIHPTLVVPPTTIISGNVTWSNKNYTVNNITVNPGGHLTISSNSTIRFGQSSSIAVIKPGGRMTINASVLSNSCNDTWSGIFVEGDRTKSQTFANQGALILQNGAVIENAHDAIHIRGLADNWWGNGGIIQATDATFRNNWRNVAFYAYDQTNASYFTNCTFETNIQTMHNLHTHNVSMWDVQGVTFTDCTFKDTRPHIDYNTYRKSRRGIYTSSASFIVNRCSFIGMEYGIYATSSVANRTLKVYQSNFSSFNGMYFNNMNNSHVFDNDFHVKPGYMYSGGPTETYGLYLENSHNFQVTGNKFTSEGTFAQCQCNSFGVIARNTGEVHQEIYRNDFSGFFIAIETIGQNRGSSSYSGLELRCNRFYNSQSNLWHHDIYVANDPTLSTSAIQGIKELQGLMSQPNNTELAGNIFSDISRYLNYGRKLWYFHHNINSHTNLKPNNINSDKFEFYNASHISYNYSTSCPVRQLSGSTQMLLAEMEDGLTGQHGTRVKLMEMTDAGNTQLMLQQVEMASERDAYDTYQHLIKTSPWLSDEVLASVASNQAGLSLAMIRDVLVANPQSARSETVNQALKNRRKSLPESMMSQIQNGANTLSEKELLEFEFISYKTRHDRALNQIISNTMHTPDNTKELAFLKGLLADTDDIRYQYMRAELQFAEGDYRGGLQILNEMGKNKKFEATHLGDDRRKYLDFYTLLQKWDTSKYPGLTNLPEEVLTELHSYVNTHHRVSGKALSILQLNNAIDYKEPIYNPEEEMVTKSAPVVTSSEVKIDPVVSDIAFTVFPNPGRDYITFSWCLQNHTTENMHIDVFQNDGNKVQTITISDTCNEMIIPTFHLPAGNYIAVMKSGNVPQKSMSFVVLK
jgi:hypothetical protein